MRIRCLQIAALAVGYWGVGTAFAQDDSDSTQAAMLIARAIIESRQVNGEKPAAVNLAEGGAEPAVTANSEAAPAVDATQGEPVPGDTKLDAETVAECCERACGRGKPGPKRCGQSWDFKCDNKTVPCEWRISGEIGAALGTSTNADNDRYEFSLREEMETCDGDKYEFYQRYDIDHSYVESNTLTIGAKQRFKDWNVNGDLRLTEEFKRYDDVNFDSNDRQEGLFDLRWDPKWACDRWRAELSYRYNIKEYETFSPLSYRMHRGRVRINEKVNESFDWGAHAEVVSYNYSFGSTRDNLRTEVGLEAGWHACDVDWNASIEHDEKEFDLKKELGYSEDRAELSMNWKVDCDSRLNARIKASKHVRPFEPDRSYDERMLDLSYMRQLTCEWALKARGMARSKQFGDPTDDMDQRMGELELTFQPDEDYTWHVSAQRDIYDYADPMRAFTRDRWRIGGDYYHADMSLGAEYERQSNSYDNDPTRDWQRDTISLSLGYHNNRHNVRVSGQFAVLDQSDPASVNDYDETQLSASWSYRIDCTTDFILSYEDRERRYDLQPAVRDRLLEARLKFEL